MSTSIYGYVEIRKFHDGSDDWYPVIDVGMAMTGNYDIFGCLFGVRNDANFKPLFPSRGFPPDCSGSIHREAEECHGHSVSWCSYEELLAIDLNELSVSPGQRYWKDDSDHNRTIRIKRFQATDDDKTKCKYISRREALDDPEYQQLLELMDVLSRRYGSDGVRMVVYFD